MRDAGLLVTAIVSIGRAFGWIFPAAAHPHAYWVAGTATPYAIAHEEATDAFLYSPAFTQLLEPLRALPYGLVVGLWTAASMLILRWMAPLLWPLLMLVFVPEIITCNVNLFLAGMVVVSFRHPGAWALAVLTKVSPGIGVAWFLVRREWHNLAVALAVNPGHHRGFIPDRAGTMG